MSNSEPGVVLKTTSHIADEFSECVAASRSRLDDATLYSYKHHTYTLYINIPSLSVPTSTVWGQKTPLNR